MNSAISQLIDFLERNQPLCVLTGAGCSTASGIPDYRDSDGRWKQTKPVYFNDFLRHESARRRYWMRSMNGWPVIDQAAPSVTHRALTTLEAGGYVSHIITQNVDGLHQKAGSRQVIDLHGNLKDIFCFSCHERSSRRCMQERLLSHNPDFVSPNNGLAPDGDMIMDDMKHRQFSIPACLSCGGMLKPDIVFFGESVPKARVETIKRLLSKANAMLIIGSSLMVYSGYRFCRLARRLGIPMAAVNKGKTRADSELLFKIEQDCCTIFAEMIAAMDRQSG